VLRLISVLALSGALPLLTFPLGLTLVATRVARAQELSVGARVRVSVPDLKIDERTGVLTRITRDSLSIDFGRDPPPLAIALDRVSRLEVAVGKERGSGFLRGATVGTMVGALAGLGVGALAVRDCTSVDAFPCEMVFVLTIPGGAAVGLIAGGLIGVANAPNRWEEVSLRRGGDELGMRGAIRPMKVGLSISF
jgi:hypothetical protein